ncbi:hypothetical protein Tco_1285977 [Tanacetum coccineum]
MKDEVNVALQLKSDKLREEAQAENQDFLNSLDSNMKRIIKEQVKAQTSKIMTKVEKYVTETLGAEVLVVTLKRGRDDQDKDEEPFAGSNRGSKRRRSGKEESSKEATQKKVDDLEEPFHQEFDTRNDNVSSVREATDVDERLWSPSGSRTPDREWNQTKTVDD